MDEEEAIKTEYCSNCRRDIPAANFVMHVTHCQRNLTLCKICGEPVPTSQQEEHFEEYHAQEKCECGQLVEKMNLEDHKEKDCPNRGVECQYCELTLPFNKMESHVEYCGSRTEKCDACGRFIQMKDFTEHENTGCQYPVKEESKKLPSNPPPDFFPGMPIDMLHAMGLDPSGNSPATDFFHPALAAGMREFGQILNTGLGTSPFSGGAAYFGGIAASNGVIDRQDVIARGAKGGRAFPKSEFDQDTFQDFDKVDDEFAQDVDDDEMLAAAFQADEFDNLNGHANGMSSAMVDEPFPYAKFTSMADSRNDANKTQLPCEFCGDLFPVDNLILHQSACQLRSLDSFPGSAAHFPDESTEHDLPQLNNSNFSRERKSRTNHTELGTKGRNRSEDDTFLPCEFCQELFPFDNLIAHQAVCDACPASRPPSALFDGSTQGPPLNNARPSVRNGTKSRPSRPVYESKKTQRPLTDFIPSELEDGDDLDFTPSVNDDLTTKDASRKPEKYSDEFGVLDSAPMNNELQRQERRTGEGHSMRGQTVLRNNDLSNRQPAAVRVKNGTADLPRKRETGPRTGLDTSYKAPAVKPAEERLGQKKLNVGSRGRPAAELVAKASRVRTSDGATGAKPRLPIMNDEPIERSRRDSDHKLNMPQSHKSEPRASKPRRVDAGSGGVKSDSSSAMRVTAPRSNRTKGAEPLPPISKAISVNGSSLHSAPSNPRRNPPTTSSLEQGVRSNRGRPRQQGSVEPVRSSNTPPASTSVPRKTSSTRKKIV